MKNKKKFDSRWFGNDFFRIGWGIRLHVTYSYSFSLDCTYVSLYRSRGCMSTRAYHVSACMRGGMRHVDAKLSSHTHRWLYYHEFKMK